MEECAAWPLCRAAVPDPVGGTYFEEASERFLTFFFVATQPFFIVEDWSISQVSSWLYWKSTEISWGVAWNASQGPGRNSSIVLPGCLCT